MARDCLLIYINIFTYQFLPQNNQHKVVNYEIFSDVQINADFRADLLNVDASFITVAH